MIPVLAVASTAVVLAAIPVAAQGWQLDLPPRPNVVFDETFYPNDGIFHLKSDMVTNCIGGQGDSACTAVGSYGAALGLNFLGSSVKVNGAASNSNASEPRPVGSFSLYDGMFPVPGDQQVHVGQGVLAAREGLAPKPYRGSMNIYWASDVKVASVSVSTGMYVNDPNAKKETVQSETIPAIQGSGLHPFYQLDGSKWKANGSGNDSFAAGSGNAMVRVNVPQNTTYVKVRGLTGPEAGPLTMSLRTREGTTKPDLASGNATLASHPQRASTTGSTLFALPLDPTKTYYFEVQADSGNFYLRDMTFWSSLPKGSSPGSAGGGANSVFGAASITAPANFAVLFASFLVYSLL
ncbi:hypothetical protein CcaverHIS002_0306940 [Cutaneotrichosporon cavernicola]|uniref:Uncharacterized protein n=1 Tax=Cutaneotrichosporon cavernicola TaxID=279322 RepID=A0AA48IFM0_9TREE|nr:uncharacterized protein CcaverHIS019_0306860 [Cutaneotrichosporon cavernicola]BEI82826.1 hypothetical protein CcaverHIS002_0306940 [Cutaneotrichosporon cavernicola]BEI90616.1 hypothetical protein CcaverHIS019_0306860 [Cutaneotrichosporon cavernicola]BEI98394.1 hypothetical protein CcaverHIS631_0306930 [Cutaneotrichosporon cavernicola]BEJ06167.1 hypothetical protein CcaverHIS641_0306890 [Cutaneotrichosporon cavernicola]